MSTIVDWGALGEVVLISVAAGLSIASILGLGIVASLRAEDHDGARAASLYAVTAVSVVLIAGAIAAGLYVIASK